MPLLDLINATMARISTADMFVTAKGVKEQGWTGPGRFKQASMQEKVREEQTLSSVALRHPTHDSDG